MNFEKGNKITFKHWKEDVIIEGTIVGENGDDIIVKPLKEYFNDPHRRNFYVNKKRLPEYIKRAIRH